VLLPKCCYAELRVGRRTTNGKNAEERELILRHLAEVEPRLRATCTHEIDATQSVAEVIAKLIAIDLEIHAGEPDR
jgi:hypothetical protein